MTRKPIQPTPLTPSQSARLRVIDIHLIITSIVVCLITYSWTSKSWPTWPLALLSLSLFAFPLAKTYRLRRKIGIRITQSLIPPYPYIVLHHASTFSLIWAWILIAPLHFYGRAVQNTEVALFIGGLIAGSMLIGLSRICFQIIEPSCARCGYPVSGRDLPGPCPECGDQIESTEHAVTHKKLRKPELVIAGIACMAATVLLARTFAANPGAVTRQLPRTQRLALAATDPYAFGSLLNDLTKDEQRVLIDSILDARRDALAPQIPLQMSWLEESFIADALSPEQSDRFALEGYRLGIRVAETADTPPSVRITLTGAPPHEPRHIAFHYFTRGFSINGRPLPVDPAAAYLASHLSTAAGLLDNPSIEHIIVYPDTRVPRPLPGDHQITTHIIAVTTRVGITPTITWHDDGTYTITPPPLTTHELTAETTLQVTP